MLAWAIDYSPLYLPVKLSDCDFLYDNTISLDRRQTSLFQMEQMYLQWADDCLALQGWWLMNKVGKFLHVRLQRPFSAQAWS